mgnify:CR=1 FL=1
MAGKTVATVLHWHLCVTNVLYSTNFSAFPKLCFMALILCISTFLLYTQGVQELPDYCKVHFPNMTPLDLQVLLPSAHSDEVDFVRQLLVLDPNKRLTAKSALESVYFTVTPLAVSAGCLYVPVRERASKSSRPKPSTTVEGFMVDVVDNIVNSSVI